MRKQRFTAAEWEDRIKAWERGGLSGVEFGRHMGVSPGVLYAWKHRLRRQARGGGEVSGKPQGVQIRGG